MLLDLLSYAPEVLIIIFLKETIDTNKVYLCKIQEIVSSDSKEKKILSAQWGTEESKCWKPTKERSNGVGGFECTDHWNASWCRSQLFGLHCLPLCRQVASLLGSELAEPVRQAANLREKEGRESFHLIWIIQLVLPTYELGKKLKLFWSKRWRITWT